jgi:hypothetical protein
MTDTQTPLITNPAEMKRPEEYLTIEYGRGNNGLHTTPDSFGEGARGRFERNGPCLFWGCP